MKKIYLLSLLGLLFLWSCADDVEEKEQKQENVVEDNIKDISKNKELGQEIVQEPVVDAKFKSFLIKFGKASLPYKIAPDGTEEYEKMPLSEQVDYLSKAEKLSADDLKDMQEETDFYYVNSPINTDKFHAIVYGRFEMGSVYYSLCTYDNDGKLVSNIEFAAYEMLTAGPQAGQELNTNGSIDENYEVVVEGMEETRKYKIQADGKIVQQ